MSRATGLDSIDAALDWLGDGGLVAYPTETVWGLAARAGDAPSVERLRAWKGRGPAQPISILIESPEALARVANAGAAALRLAARYWPGPLTLVVPARIPLAPGIANAERAIGVRCSPHPTARALAAGAAQRALGPLTATSLNHGGQPAARTRGEARALCRSGCDPRLLEAPGPDAGGGAESSVVDCTASAVRVLREAAIGSDEIQEVAGAPAPRSRETLR